MYTRLICAAAALLLFTTPAFSDVLLDLRTTSTSATTRPADADSSVSVLAVPGHDFFTKYTTGDNTIEVSGSVQAMPDGQFRVAIKLDSHGGGVENVATTVELKAGEPVTLSGAQGGKFTRATILTIKQAPAR